MFLSIVQKDDFFAFLSDANLPLFGKIRRFFDQMGHFCELSRTDEKNLVVLGGVGQVCLRFLI